MFQELLLPIQKRRIVAVFVGEIMSAYSDEEITLTAVPAAQDAGNVNSLVT